MSLEVIEMMIKESLRDGEISASERETLVKQGESFGISKETVSSMIESEINKHQERKSIDKKQKQEEDESREREKMKKEISDITLELDNFLAEYSASDNNEKKSVISKAKILTYKLKRKGEIELAKEYDKQFKNPDIIQYLFIGGIILFLIIMAVLAQLGLFGEGIFG